ncbi:MAG TPA: FliM/FliN family flagellar motor switch protein, partial [Vicinamibacterales bacterium]|nr:FliM/FliN family flagellar motor switch protein [Vicinamibacterales bacterium]
IVSVETFTYSDFLSSLPDPTVFYSLGLAPLDGLGALELSPEVAFIMIDRMLGGRGASQPANRALTEIEQNVVDGVIRLILENLSAAWRRIFDVQFRIHARETRPQILQVAAPGDAMVLVVFEVHLGDTKGTLHLCLPAAVGASVPQGWQSTRRDPSPAEARHLARNLGRVSVPLTAVLRAELAARDILAIRPGDVISLGRPMREPIEVRAWDTLKLLGQPTLTEAGPGLSVQSWVGTTEGEATQ